MSTDNANKCAFPVLEYGALGLTKIEYFAAMAMSSMLGLNEGRRKYGDFSDMAVRVASESVTAAYALLHELEERAKENG